MRVDGQTKGRADITKLTVTFRNFAYVSKNRAKYEGEQVRVNMYSDKQLSSPQISIKLRDKTGKHNHLLYKML
jgi:hypothetical protein